MFIKAAQLKFDKGAKDHADQEWETLDARAEIMDELLDTYWYATKLEDDKDLILSEVGRALKKLSQGYWEQLYDTLPKNKQLAQTRVDAERNMFVKIKNRFVK